MRVITARPRHYVIFCGAVFAKLLPAGSAVREHDFHLTKTDRSQTKNRFYFAELRVPWEGREIHAGLARSWAQQGIPMGAHAEEIVARNSAAGQYEPSKPS